MPLVACVSLSQALPSPFASKGRVYILEVIERDDSSNTSDIADYEDISIQEVPLSMAPPATVNILESAYRCCYGRRDKFWQTKCRSG